jgi:hypothetical protein
MRGLLILALIVVGIESPRRLIRLAPALLTAGCLLLVWKHQVRILGGGEMAIGDFAAWQWSALPATLESMLTVSLNKPGYFALAIGMCLVGPWLLWRRGRSRVSSILVLFTVLFLGFNVFLTWTYIAVFFGYEGISAASFWRYNTQLGAVQLVALAALAGACWRRFGDSPAKARIGAIIGTVCLAIVLIGPIAGAGFLRFDVHKVKAHVAAVAKEMRPLLPPDAKVWYVDPPRTGLNNHLEYYLGFGVQVAGSITYFTPEDQYRPLLESGRGRFAYVINPTPGLERAVGLALPDGASYLIERDPETGWRIIKSWPFKGFASAKDLKY